MCNVDKIVNVDDFMKREKKEKSSFHTPKSQEIFSSQ